MKTLPNNNYLIRELKTNRTQIFHRLRLKPCSTKDKSSETQDFQPNNDIEVLHDDQHALAWQSGFEHFVKPNNSLPNDEHTMIQPDIVIRSEDTIEDIVPDLQIEFNHTQESHNSESDPKPDPRREKQPT